MEATVFVQKRQKVVQNNFWTKFVVYSYMQAFLHNGYPPLNS